MEELYHFRQAKMVGAWGKRRLSPSEIKKMEESARKFLKHMGFEEMAPGALPPVGY